MELDPEPVFDDGGRPVIGPDGKQAMRRRLVRKGRFASKKAAQAWLDDKRQQAKQGVDVSRRITLGDYLAEWLAGKGDIKPATRASYTQHVEKFWVPKVGRHEVGALRKAHVQVARRQLRLPWPTSPAAASPPSCRP